MYYPGRKLWKNDTKFPNLYGLVEIIYSITHTGCPNSPALASKLLTTSLESVVILVTVLGEYLVSWAGIKIQGLLLVVLGTFQLSNHEQVCEVCLVFEKSCFKDFKLTIQNTLGLTVQKLKTVNYYYLPSTYTQSRRVRKSLEIQFS